MVDLGSCGRAIDRSGLGVLQMVRESAIDCLTVYRVDHTDMSFLRYHGSEWRNKGMRRNTEIGVVIYGRIMTCYLCFTYTPVFTVSLVIGNQETECEPNHQPTFLPCQVLPLPSARTIQFVTMPQGGALR